MTHRIPFSKRRPRSTRSARRPGDDDLVLGVAVVEPDGDLRAVGGDDQGHHAAAPGEDDAVDHHHRHVDLRKVAGQQLGQLGLGGAHEAAAHRRLRGGLRRLLDGLADRLAHEDVAPGGHAGEHALHHELAQQVPGAEQAPGVEHDLARAVGAHRPWPLHGHRAPAEDDRARRRAVPGDGALRVVAALGPGDLGELGLHDRLEHAQAGRARQRHEAVAAAAATSARAMVTSPGRPSRRAASSRCREGDDR